MAEYHFVSTWQIQAPVERVWDEIYHAERWPSWWKYVAVVEELEPGAPDGVGKRLHLLFRTRLPYQLGFDLRTTRVQLPTTLEAEATGELEGTGRWTFTPANGGTLVTYNPKAHMEFTNSDGILVSYNVNANTGSDLVCADDYKPRFIRMQIPGVTN